MNVSDYTLTHGYTELQFYGYWSDSNNTLQITPSDDFPAGTLHNLTVSGLAIPSSGILKNAGAGITIYLETSTSDINQAAAAPSTINFVPAVGTFTSPNLAFGGTAAPSTAGDITFTTTLGPGGFAVGDEITIHLPAGFTHSTLASSAVSVAVYDTEAAYNAASPSVSTIWSASFSAISNTLSYTCLITQTTTFSVSTFIPASSGVVLPSSPIDADEDFYLTAASAESPVAHKLRMPDSTHGSVGGFTSGYPTLSYSPALLEDTSAYTISVVVKAETDIAQNDVIYLVLPYFTGSSFTNSAQTYNANGLAHALTYTWMENGATASSGGITYSCDSAATPCLKVVVNAMTIPSGTEFTISVPNSLGISVPSEGVPSATHGAVAFAQLAKGNINVPKAISSTICSGFCTSSISYSALSTSSPSTGVTSGVTISFSLGVNLAIGEYVEVTLPSFTGSNNGALTLTSDYGSFTGAWTLGTTKLRLTAGSVVNANTVVSVVVGDGQITLPTTALSGDCASDGITIATDAQTFAASSGSTVLTSDAISCEELQVLGTISDTSFEFFPTVVGEEASIYLNFTLDNAELNAGDKFTVTYSGSALDWYQPVKTNLTISGYHENDLNATLSDGGTFFFQVRPGRTIPAGTNVKIILREEDNHIKVPSIGISQTSTSFTITATTHDRYFAPSTTMTQISAIPTFTSTSILSYDTTSSVLPGSGVTNVTVQFATRNTVLQAGDNITLTFEGFSYAEQLDKVNATCAIWHTPTCKSYRPSWDAATSSLHLTARETVNSVALQTHVIKFPGAGLIIPSSGLVDNDPRVKISMSFEDTSTSIGGSSYADYPAFKKMPVGSSPCVGLCSAAVSFDVPKAGAVVGMNINLKTSMPLRTGDRVSMNLTEIVQGPLDQTLVLEGSDGANFTGVFTGTSNGMAPTGTGILVLTCTSHIKKTEVALIVSRLNELNIPAGGIPSGHKFNVNATAPNSFGSTVKTTAPSSVTPVGSLTSSRLRFDMDYLHGTDYTTLSNTPSTLQFNLAFSSTLLPKEQIYIYLPGFTSSATSLTMKSGDFPLTESDDFSASWSPSASTITLILNPLSPPIFPYTDVNFTIAGSQITLPSTGILRNETSLLVSTNALDGPVASAAIVDTPAVGAVTRAEISFYRGRNQTKMGQLHSSAVGDIVSPGNPTGIRLKLAFNGKLANADVVRVTLPGFIHPDETSLSVITYMHTQADELNHDDTAFSGSWDSSTKLLSLTCASATGCSSNNTHPLTIDVTEPNNFISPKDGALYGHDDGVKVATESDEVPVSSTTITDVAGVGFHSFQLGYSPATLPGSPTSTYVAAGDPATIDIVFRMSYNMKLSPGDNMTCVLPSFTIAEDDALTKSVIATHGDPNFDFTRSHFDEATSTLSVKVNGTISYGDGDIPLKVTGLNLPTAGISTAQSSAISCGATHSSYDPANPDPSDFAFNFSTPLGAAHSQTVGYFSSTSLSFNPRVAGEDTSVTLSFQLNSPLAASDSLSLYLPGFALSSTVALSSPTSSPVAFSPAFSGGASSTLTLTPSTAILNPSTVISITVDGLTLPTNGISPTQSSIAMTTTAAQGAVVKPTAPATITGVGYFPVNKVSFLPATLESTKVFGGTTNRFKLRRGHSLHAEDFVNEVIFVGTSYSSGQFLTVEKVEGDVLVTTTPYTGPRVTEKIPSLTSASLPATQVYLPGYRPATFAYGSGNTDGKLTFKYTVQPGDVSSDVALRNATRNVEISGSDWIRRTSTNPTTEASLALPGPNSAFSVSHSAAVEIDTTEPTVVNVTTTKRNGNYGQAGTQIEITVAFTRPVSIYYPSAPKYSMPILALNVITNDNTTRYAYYHSGDKTKEITFMYTVQPGDLTRGELFYKDTRNLEGGDLVSAIISRFGQNEGYIMRSATNLVQYANTSLPRAHLVNSFDHNHNIHVNNRSAWKFPFVTGVDSLKGDGVYGAGEIIDLLVTFSENVTVNRNGGWPYIEMDVNDANTRRAFLLDGKTDGHAFNNSLVFRYIVKPGDTSADLDYKCTCSDYTQTTYIMTNGTVIRDKNDTEVDYQLPPVSSNNNLAAKRSIRIDTAAPTIVSLSSPHLDGVYGVGDEVPILVVFDKKIFVAGNPRLTLGSERQAHAYYSSGNNTNVLVFIYKITSNSYHSMSDLATHPGKDSTIDLNGGKIKHLSDDPTTDAILVLPSSGHFTSLGHSNSIVIDGAPPKITSTTVSAPATSFYANHQTIDVIASSRNVTSGQFRILYNDLHTPCMTFNVTGEDMEAALVSTNGLSVRVTRHELGGYKNYGAYGARYNVEFLNPSNGVASMKVLLGEQSYGAVGPCASFKCTNATSSESPCPPSDVPTFDVNRDSAMQMYSGLMDVTAKFSTAVVVSGTPILSLETGMSDAKARFAPNVVQHVDVGVFGSSPLFSGQFQLAYGGFVTGCIDYNNADSVGYNSMLNRLKEIPGIKSVGIRSITRSDRGNGYRFEITFKSGSNLEQVTAVERSARANLFNKCSSLAPSDAFVAIPPSDTVTFRYPVPRGSRLILKANADVPASTAISLLIPSSSGISLPKNGLSSTGYKQLGFSSVFPSHSMKMVVPTTTALSPSLGSFGRLSLHFGPGLPDSAVGIDLGFSLDNALQVGETVSVLLPSFTMAGCVAGVCANLAKTTTTPSCDFNVDFVEASPLLLLTVQTADIEAGEQCDISIATSVAVKSGPAAIFGNSGAFKIGTNAASGKVSELPIVDTNGIGLTSTKLTFGNPRPAEVSPITIEFAPADFIKNASDIQITLPSFRTATCDSSVQSVSDVGGYDGSYFTATFTCAPTPTLLLTPNRILYPRLHSLTVDGGIYIPAKGVHPALNACTIKIRNGGGGTYSDVGTTSIFDVQKIGSFTGASLGLSNPTAGEYSSFNITFKPDMDMNKNESITFTLPGFSGQTTSSPVISNHDGHNSTMFEVLWDNFTETLTLNPLLKVQSNRTYTVDLHKMNRLRVPRTGISSDYAGLVSTNCNNGPIPHPTHLRNTFSFPNVGAIIESKMLFSSTSTNVTTAIKLEIETNTELERGSVITFHLPGFTCPYINVNVTGEHADYVATALWSAAAETVTVTVGGDSASIYDFAPAKLNLDIPESMGFKLPITGLSMNDKNIRMKIQSTEAPVPNYERIHMLSGLGFISSNIDFYPAVAGSNDADIHFSFATTKALLALETVLLRLPPAFDNDAAAAASTDLIIGGPDAASFSAVYLKSEGSIRITALTDIMVRKQEIVFDKLNKIKVPKTGVTRNDESFTLSINSANMGTIVEQPVRHTMGVGSFVDSQVTFATPVAGSATDIIVSFRYSSVINTGEIVTIVLADFTADKEFINVLATSGSHGSKFTSSWKSDTHELRLVVNPGAQIAADELVVVRVLSTNNVRLPQDGVALGDPSILASCNAGSGAVVTPVTVENTTAVGAILSSDISFNPSDVGGNGQFRFLLTTNEILQVGDTVKLRLPQFNGTVHIAPTDVLALTGSNSDNFNATWDYRDDIMTFEVVKELDTKSIDVYLTQANNFALRESSIFEGEDGKSGITVKVNSTVMPIIYSKNVNVKQGTGFTNASLSFDPLGAGLATDVAVTWTLGGDLLVGEKVHVQLKTFTGVTNSFNISTGGFPTLTYDGPTTPVAITSPTGHKFKGEVNGFRNITFTCMENIPKFTTVTAVVPKSSGITLPANLLLTINDPDMRIWTDSAGVDATPPLRVVSIPYSPPMGFMSSSSLSYSHLIANQAVQITLAFTTGVDLAADDVVTVFLDGFAGDDVAAVALDGTGNAGDFDISWTETYGTLALTANKALSAGTFSLVVTSANNIRLPPYPLALNDDRLAISSNAVAGPIYKTKISSSPAVGYFPSSSVEFVSDTQLSADHSVDLLCKWRLSSDLAVGEYVRYALPGYYVKSSFLTEISLNTKRYVKLFGLSAADVNNAFTTYGLDVTNDILLSPGGSNGLNSFVAVFNDNSNTLTFFAEEKINNNDEVSIVINYNNGMFLPTKGVSENDPAFSIATNAALAPVDDQRVDFVEPHGVANSKISFDPPIAGATTEITFSVNLTCPLAKGDHINLNMTNFGGPVKHGSAAAPSGWQSQIVMGGGDGSRDYKSMWNATWDNQNDILRLESNGIMDDTFVTVVISGDENNITLPVDGISESDQILMFISANCTGELKDVPIETVPVVGALTTSQLSLMEYIPGSPTDIALTFTTATKLYANEELVFHMEGFEIDHDTLISEDSDDDATAVNSVYLMGTSAASFSAEFTTGDVAQAISLPSTAPFTLPTAGDYIRRHATNPTQDADLTFASTDSIDVVAAIDSTSAPFVISVVSHSGSGPHFIGEIVKFSVKFDKAVAVDATGGKPSLLLQFDAGRRVAVWKENESSPSSLVFVYIVAENDVSSNLKIAGKYALDPNGAMITSSGKGLSIVSANVTVPPPFDYLAKNGITLQQEKIVVSGTTSIGVVDVRTPSPSGDIYLAGDVIDIEIEFGVKVEVTGSPYLLLRSGVDQNATAFYTGAKVTQVVEAGVYSSKQTLSGGFMLTYGDDVTGCIDWDTASGSANGEIGNGLLDRLNALPSINAAGGVKSVTKTLKGNGNSFDVKFNFANPEQLGYDPNSVVYCEQFNDVSSSGAVAFPLSKVLNFRYIVQPNDSMHQLEYQGVDALVVPSGSSILVSSSRATTPVSVVMPVPGTSSSLSGKSNIPVNGTSPAVQRVFSSPGTYGYGTWLDIEVRFNLPVKVTGTPQLQLNTGFVKGLAPYISGSGSKSLQFRYTVSVGDNSPALNYTDKNALLLPTAGDKINVFSDLALLPANLTLPDPKSVNALGASAVKVVVDPNYRAQVESVSSTNADGYYTEGDEVDIHVKFTRDVRVKTLENNVNPYLVMETGPDDAKAGYVSGSGTHTLRFKYLIRANDTTFDLNSTRLELNSSLIEDFVGNNASTAFDHWTKFNFLADNNQIVIDQSVPAVQDVGSYTPDGIYSPGDDINIWVKFNYDVVVTGMPGVELNIYDRLDHQVAWYTSGSGGKLLNFTYRVPFEDISKDYDKPYIPRLDYGSTESLFDFMNGGKIQRKAINPTKNALVRFPVIDHSDLFKNHEIAIDSHQPYVIQVDSPTPAGMYGPGEEIFIELKWSAPVIINGTGDVMLETGLEDFYAPLHSGNNSDTLVFRYVVQRGDSTPALDVVDTRNDPWNINVKASLALVVSGQHHNPLAPMPTSDGPTVVIQRASTNPGVPVIYGIPIPGQAGSLSHLKTIRIDDAAPTVTKVRTTLVNGTYGIGEIIPVFVDFTLRVAVVGEPVIEMKTNNDADGGDSNGRFATYVSGSGTSTLLFHYLVKFGDSSDLLDYAGVDSLTTERDWTARLVNELSYIRGYSHDPTVDANLSLPPPGLKATVISPSSLEGSYHQIRLQTDGLKVIDVASSFNSGIYSWGEEVPITVEFNGAVSVSGIPKILMDVSVPNYAYYVGIDAGERLLHFVYIVATTDQTQDFSYVDKYSLVLDDGVTIVSSANDQVHAVTTLPVNGEVGSMRFNNDIVLAGTKPVVVDMRFDYIDGEKYKDGVTFGCGEIIYIYVEFDQKVDVLNGVPTIKMNTGTLAYYYGGGGTNIITFQYVVVEGDSSQDFGAIDTEDALLVYGAFQIVSHSSIIIIEADLTLPSEGGINSLSFSNDVVIDTTQTNVVGVKFMQDAGVYGVGNIISIEVEFDNPVSVGGLVELELNTGGAQGGGGKAAYYKGGNDGHSRKILFKYTITEHDVSSDLDYSSLDALILDETELDAGGRRVNYIMRYSTTPIQDANLVLPKKGEVSSLGRSNDIIVNSLAPHVVNVTSSNADGEISSGDLVNIFVSYSERVYVDAAAAVDKLVMNMNTGGVAKFAGGNGTKTLHFQYTVAGGDVGVEKLDYVCSGFCESATSDGVNLPNPLDNGGMSCAVYAVSNGVCGGLVLPPSNGANSISDNKNIIVSQQVPKALSVTANDAYSPYGYGVGHELFFSVLFDKKVVVVGSGSDLQLSLRVKLDTNGGIAKVGVATYVSGSSTDTLVFKYVVAAGDGILAVEITDADALSGVVMRYSGLPSIVAASATLPTPHKIKSISHSTRIMLNTETPYVESVFPLKRPGVYVSGEKIAVVVRFSQPVSVTGTPRLYLNVENANSNSGGYAEYLPTKHFNESDVNFDIQPTDMIMVYTLSEGDTSVSLEHNGTLALQMNGGGILRDSTNPTTGVVTTMRAIDDFEVGDTNGRVDGSWTAYYPKKVEVIVRDLWHEHSADLTIQLSHGNRSATLFDKPDPNKDKHYTFGEANEFYASRANDQENEIQLKRRHLNGIGYDYLFGDVIENNLALRGVAKQSSTKYHGHADRAIDGNVDGFVSRESISHTGGHGENDPEPWWQVRLEESSEIECIRIWNRQVQQARDEIQVITVVHPTEPAWPMPVGEYDLKIDMGGGLGEFVSDKIDAQTIASRREEGADSVGSSLQSKIEKMTGLVGAVDVSRSHTTTFDGAKSGYQYTVTFIGYNGDLPKLNLQSKNFTFTPDAEVLVEERRNGVANEYYNYKNKGVKVDYEAELFPFFLMVFEDGVVPEEISGGLEEVLKAAIWYEEIFEVKRMSVVLPELPLGKLGRTVRIQFSKVYDNNYLSLAEVEVFKKGLHPMSKYVGGTPVAEKSIVSPYVAEDSLTETFKNFMYGGAWTLSITDHESYSATTESGVLEEKNGRGSVNDYILVITDQCNNVDRYYVETQALLKTLPKYGDLYVKEFDDRGNGEWWTQNEGVKTGEEKVMAVVGMERNLGPCYGVDTTGLNGVRNVGNHRYCPLNFGVGNLLNTQKSGSVSEQRFLVNERVIFYRPFADFEGNDHFTFSNVVGQQELEEVEVRVNVRNCRRFYSNEKKGIVETEPDLCACKRTEENLFGDPVTCPGAVASTCAGEGSDIYGPMCVECVGSVFTDFTADCKVEIDRAVSLLEVKGRCVGGGVVPGGVPDCSSESISTSSREPFVLYSSADYTGGRGLVPIKMN